MENRDVEDTTDGPFPPIIVFCENRDVEDTTDGPFPPIIVFC